VQHDIGCPERDGEARHGRRSTAVVALLWSVHAGLQPTADATSQGCRYAIRVVTSYEASVIGFSWGPVLSCCCRDNTTGNQD
jgi:hypothetical protein